MAHFVSWPPRPMILPKPWLMQGPFSSGSSINMNWQPGPETEIHQCQPLLVLILPRFIGFFKSSPMPHTGRQDQLTSILTASLGFGLKWRAGGDPPSQLCPSRLGKPPPESACQTQAEGWNVGRGVLVHGPGDNLQEAQCPSCPPLSINSPLACGSGVASNSLIYVTAVLLTN